jgi:DNA invertase Pin-like site-specific DNA recombinase
LFNGLPELASFETLSGLMEWGGSMFIGYARISTEDQKLDLQLDALKKVGCKKFFQDVASGSKSQRVGLDAALEFARKGDVIVVWKLDRLGRSLQHLIETITLLQSRGVGFRSLQENIDTTTAGGKLFFHIFGALAEFERELIRERTKAGLSAARARGRLGGRKPVMTEKKIRQAKALLADPANRISDICAVLQVSRATLYKYIKANGSN